MTLYFLCVLSLLTVKKNDSAPIQGRVREQCFSIHYPAREREQPLALFSHQSNVTALLCSNNVVTAVPPEEVISQESLWLTTGCFFFSPPLRWKPSRCSKSPLHVWCEDLCRFTRGGGLCDGVSTVKVTKSCNQSLFTVDPALYFHNISPLILSLIPDCRCDVRGTLSGVGDCQQVSCFFFFLQTRPEINNFLIKLSFRL